MSSALDPGRRWLHRSYAYGLLVAVLLGYSLMRIPIQVFDCFSDMLSLQRSMGYLIQDAFRLPSYLRPGRWVFQKLVFDLSNGQYFYAFRLTQVAQVLALILLFIKLVQPRTAVAASVIPLSLAVLVGSHTFAYTVREAFPINHFLTIVLCCAAAANVSFARYRWWNDVLAVLLFIAAAGTLESGLLVWVIVVAGFALGLRGVSTWGVVATTACLVGYFAVRFVVLDVGMPGLELREAGFGFFRYTADEISALFSANPVLFYAYNVGASVLGVLFAEPRDGVWRMTRDVMEGQVRASAVVDLLSSALATMLVAWFAWTRRRNWMSWSLERRDQLVLMGVAVIGANAVISYAYTKDVIMSPAGLFLAAAVSVAVADRMQSLATASRLSVFATTLLLAVLSVGWGIRSVGIHAALDRTSFQVRQQWANVDEYIPRWRERLTPEELALKEQLQDDAVRGHPARPVVRENWTRLFDID